MRMTRAGTPGEEATVDTLSVLASEVTVQHEDQKFDFTIQDDCSISTHLARRGVFYELGFLETLRRSLPADDGQVAEGGASGSVVVDVGAHIGNHTVFFAAVMDRPVLALEANPDTAALLRRNVAANTPPGRVEVVEAAVSDGAHPGCMRRQTGDDAGTFSLELVGEPGGTDTDPGLELVTTTLDDVWSASALAGRGPPRVVLVKIDVEGHEAAVLRGATGLLRAHRPLVTTEVAELEHFGAVHVEMSALGYVPIAAMNPTATVFWVTPDGVCGHLAHDHPILAAGVTHAVQATYELNRARRSALPPSPEGDDRQLLIVLGRHDPCSPALAEAMSAIADVLADLFVVHHVALSEPPSDGRDGVARPRRSLARDIVRAEHRFGPTALVVAERDPETTMTVRTLANGLNVPWLAWPDGDIDHSAGTQGLFERLAGALPSHARRIRAATMAHTIKENP